MSTPGVRLALKVKHLMTIAECAKRASDLMAGGFLTPKNMFRRPLCGGPGKWLHESATPERKAPHR